MKTLRLVIVLALLGPWILHAENGIDEEIVVTGTDETLIPIPEPRAPERFPVPTLEAGRPELATLPPLVVEPLPPIPIELPPAPPDETPPDVSP